MVPAAREPVRLPLARTSPSTCSLRSLGVCVCLRLFSRAHKRTRVIARGPPPSLLTEHERSRPLLAQLGRMPLRVAANMDPDSNSALLDEGNMRSSRAK
ncbi:hypothetical protein FRC12_017004 [Ceratobasidium sp. 428]|nr:hypothetical protein FRC12_017004 [Ceratobasidium sp. 428]